MKTPPKKRSNFGSKITPQIFAIPLILTFGAAFINAPAQTGPAIQWQNTIGGNDDDLLNSIQQTNDGGYILGGSSISNITGDKTENSIGNFDYWIVKTDSLGNIQWQNTIGGSAGDHLLSTQQTTDGGYILGGYSYSHVSGDKTENTNGGNDYWIVKTDSIGNIQWQNTIGGSNEDYLISIQQTTDGGYILGGHSRSDSSGDKTENCIGNWDYWMVKTDSIGNIQWQNTIGGYNEDWLSSIQQTYDGGFIVGGNSKSDISSDKTENCIGNYDYWMVKTDSIGNIQWQNTIGGNTGDWLCSIQQTADGGYMLGGYSQSDISGDKTENSIGVVDYWIVKTDAIGNTQWQNTIGGNNSDWLYSINQTADGGYIVGGTSQSNISGDKAENCIGDWDYWIVKTDSTGNIQWQNTIGGNHSDELGFIKQTTDDGYILSGYSRSNISGDKTENNVDTNCIPQCTTDYWIIKLAPDTATSIFNIQSSIFNLRITPNPAKDNITITLPNQLNNSITISLISSLGQIIYTTTVSNATKSIIIPLSTYPKGMYVAKVVSGDRVYTSRFVIQ